MEGKLMTLIVGRLKEKDKEDWLSLWNQADGWSLKNNCLDIPESNWREIFSDKNRLLAFGLYDASNAKLVGYVLYRFNVCVKTAGDECFICDLFVAPAFRRQGGGQKLMQAVEQEAKQVNAERISWTANPKRPESMGFYSSISSERMDQVHFVRWLAPLKKAS
jgi:GNAT superfamily N-acetyltransferase